MCGLIVHCHESRKKCLHRFFILMQTQVKIILMSKIIRMTEVQIQSEFRAPSLNSRIAITVTPTFAKRCADQVGLNTLTSSSAPFLATAAY